MFVEIPKIVKEESSMDKKYYKNIDFLRFFACLAIILYHLGILKGGFLAVNLFFVLSGYFSVKSAFKEENFSYRKYYLNRLKKIYLPLAIVVFLTTFGIGLIENSTWFNLKPETNSVLFGYNNFWQLSANLDYFSRHINSPFIHFWYLAILLQFELIFPFLFRFLKKSAQKFGKWLPCILTFFLGIIGAFYFYYSANKASIMFSYYDTFTRVYPLIFGVFLGFVHQYKGPLVPKSLRNTVVSKFIFGIYIVAMAALFLTIDASNTLYPLAMILLTFISCRTIDYAVFNTKSALSLFDRGVRKLASVSYEVYLVQYPLIFFYQECGLNENYKAITVFIGSFILAFIIHFALNFKRSSKINLLKFAALVVLLRLTLFGMYTYIITPDHTKEMKALETELEENENLVREKQEEYAAKLREEEEKLKEELEKFDRDAAEIKELIKDLPVVGIGDSVMLGATDNLYKQFPNGYFDAKVSRSIWTASSILDELTDKDLLKGPIVINLGANGDCTTACKNSIIEKVGERDLFWVTVTNDDQVHINDKLQKLAEEHSNLYIIDWAKISEGHKEYFYADGIHLTVKGRVAYTNAIFDAIHEVYLNRFLEKKEQFLDEKAAQEREKITFYGNGALLNLFDYIKDDYDDVRFVAKKELSYKETLQDIESAITNDMLTHRIVFINDKSSKITINDYEKLIKKLGDKEVYIVALDKDTKKELEALKEKNIAIIDFYGELANHEDYLMRDKVHLSKKGNTALKEMLNRILGKEKPLQ